MKEDYIVRSFQKIDDDLTFLMNCFREVLEELGEHCLASNLLWINQVKVDAEPNPRLCRAYSIAFQLLNMVEENVAAQVRRSRESEIGLSGEPGLWADHLRKMRESRIAETQIAEELNKIRIEPILTAHPTEAKRLAVLEQHRALHGLIVGRENPMWTALEQEEQGETITQKYANRSTATYNLELLLAGVTGITLRQRHLHEPLDDAVSVIGELSKSSRNAYRALLGMELVCINAIASGLRTTG
jgi:phosphoenolpyruvate carboxylase